MPDPTLSAALKEAYASAPSQGLLFHTLELWHPAFTDPIRVVLAEEDNPLDARLEVGAPRDAGAIVTFVPYAFEVVRPELTTSGNPQCTIVIDNVSRDILAQVDVAAESTEPTTVIYREFLEGSEGDGPENDPPLEMTITAISADAFQITATAGFPDLVNRAFPNVTYDAETFAGLVT